MQTWLGLTHTIDHAWIDGVFTNFTCEWQISAIPGYIVQLTVVTFETKSCCENVTVSFMNFLLFTKLRQKITEIFSCAKFMVHVYEIA